MDSNAQGNSARSTRIINISRGAKILNEPQQVSAYVVDVSAERLRQAEDIAQLYHFRVPEFYLHSVLNGKADDPLLDIIFPSIEEREDGEELWDSTPSPYRASDSPFWIQKYEYQGLIRTTTFCSGLCRFCYLKKKNIRTTVMRIGDVNKVYDDLEKRGHNLREIILSGGDPLAAPADTLKMIGLRTKQLHSVLQKKAPHITIHTREPVWDPVRLLYKRGLWEALDELQPKTIMINVLHPREVTSEFLEVCSRLADVGGSGGRPALLCQHPLFRGVNDSVEILEELYDKLLTASPPVLPYYIVHPFYNGTLKKHQLTLEESQGVFQQLVRRPGCITPRLVVPTPLGKCIIGPYEQIPRIDGAYQLTTKDGRKVLMR